MKPHYEGFSLVVPSDRLSLKTIQRDVVHPELTDQIKSEQDKTGFRIVDLKIFIKCCIQKKLKALDEQ